MCKVREDIEIELDRQVRENVIWQRLFEREQQRTRRIIAERQRLESERQRLEMIALREVEEILQREREEERRRLRSLRTALSRLNEERDRESL